MINIVFVYSKNIKKTNTNFVHNVQKCKKIEENIYIAIESSDATILLSSK